MGSIAGGPDMITGKPVGLINGDPDGYRRWLLEGIIAHGTNWVDASDDWIHRGRTLGFTVTAANMEHALVGLAITSSNALGELIKAQTIRITEKGVAYVKTNE